MEEPGRLSQDPDLPSPGVLANRMHARSEIAALSNETKISEHDRYGCMWVMGILMRLDRDDLNHVERLDLQARQNYLAGMRQIEADAYASPVLRAAAGAMREELERT